MTILTFMSYFFIINPYLKPEILYCQIKFIYSKGSSMIVKPMIRNNICINAHPLGCAKDVKAQISFVKQKKQARQHSIPGPKNVLVIGCSTGYGLASRITATFEYGATTVGVSYEKPATETKSGTPGWYNNAAFDKAAEKEGVFSLTINMDAFSNECREAVIQEAKKHGLTFDLVIYSLASPVRTDPVTGTLYRSVLKPVDKPYTGPTLDMLTGKISQVSVQPAEPKEIAETIKVMGGEDWELWITRLQEEGVLTSNCKTIAYSYIGPEISKPIYRWGTIGQAKQDLEKAAYRITSFLQKCNNSPSTSSEKIQVAPTLVDKNKLDGYNSGITQQDPGAFVSVNKAIVTRSSAIIPIIPLYLSLLYKVMKAKSTHENAIQQIERLFAEKLYTGSPIPVDEKNRIRIDEYELDKDVQTEVHRRLEILTEENLSQLGDLEGYLQDFMVNNGFQVEGVDYTADLARMDDIGA